MILLALLLQAADRPALVVPSVVRPCGADDGSDDIIVCGRRSAARYRIPAAVRTHDAVPAADVMQGDLIRPRNPVQEMSPFLVGAGLAGVSAGATFGPGAGSGKIKAGGIGPPAP